MPPCLHRALLAAGILGGLWAGVLPAAAEPDEPPLAQREVDVPDVRRLPPLEAARRLTAAGLNPGRLFRIRVPEGWQHGLVVQQAPPPSTPEAPQRLPIGSGVALAISGAADGPPAGIPPPASWPRVAVVPPPPPDDGPEPADELPLAPAGALPLPPPPPMPPTVAPPAREPRTPAPPVAEPVTPPPVTPSPVTPSPVTPPPPAPPPLAPVAEAPPAPPPVPLPPLPEIPPETSSPNAPITPLPEKGPPAVPTRDPGAPRATGSPDAPAIAPPPDPGRVPALLGLLLTDAEHQAGQAGMTLYVERVAGQPVGRVLEQVPDPGAARPPAGVVKVVLAAGGDHPARLAPPPRVAVREIAVPDLLDRTAPQAERILEDLGLVAVLAAAERGPAGRVADQEPAAGMVVAKGTEVVVRVAPARVAPAEAGEPETPAPPSAGASGPPPAGAPIPLAPGASTSMGGERALAVGFTWRPLPAAEAYVVEIEERGVDGWLPIARTVARTNAVVVEVERLATPPGALRWRVLAVVRGRQGPSCPWVVLR